MATQSPVWTLHDGIVEKSFAAWGLKDLHRQQTSQANYSVTFTGQRLPFDGTPLFTYGQTVTIKRNGINWFTGPVVSIPTEGTEASESISYEVASPWHYLENITFQQEWANYNGSGYTKDYCTHVYLGQRVTWPPEVTPHETPPRYTGAPVTVYADTATALADILTWARGCAPGKFDFDPSMPAVLFPIDEARDINCAEAIRRVTKWLRDLVIWWDFTPAIPILHFSRRSATANTTAGLTDATLAIGKRPLASVKLTPRYDLQVPAVVIRYEATQEINGAPSLYILHTPI